MNAPSTAFAFRPRHSWRRFWLLLGAFFVVLYLASIVPTPGAWSDMRSQWAAPAAIAFVALLFLFATHWTYWHSKAITRLQVWILSLLFGAVLVVVVFALRECIVFSRGVPNHRAALDAGIAFCYLSDVVGPARVSAGR